LDYNLDFYYLGKSMTDEYMCTILSYIKIDSMMC